jgi:hypothetical protein
MLGQLWVVDEPEPVDGFEVAAGAGDAAVVAASAGPARARAAPPAIPTTGTAARSQSFLLSIDITSMSWTRVPTIMERVDENTLGNGCELGVSAA